MTDDFDFEPDQEATLDDHIRDIVEEYVDRAMDQWVTDHKSVLKEHLQEEFTRFYGSFMERFKSELPKIVEASK